MHFVFIFNRAKLPDKNYDVDGVMSELMWYMRKPEDVSEEVVATVATTLEISGKTIRTLYNGLSLLKLPDTIRTAIQQGNLPVSQGYLFAANPDCPDLMKAVNGE
jgi:hypothetical protein